MTTTTNRYLSYPAAAAGISRASSGSTGWSWSAYTELVPASTITSTFYIAGLTWSWHTPQAVADTTYEWLIDLASGSGGAEVLVAQFPGSVRADTVAGYPTTMFVVLPEPKQIAANTRLSLRVAYSLATTSNTLTGMKLWYQMA